MARDGMDQIAGFLNSSAPPPVIAPEPSLVTLVSGRDDTPEGAGIFRVFGDRDQPADSTADAKATADKPLPPKAAEEPSQGRFRRRGGRNTVGVALASTDGRSSGR